MKLCKFCSTRVEISAAHCPNCGSNVFLHVCENCGHTFDSGFCPNCGVKAGAVRKVCPDCGTAYFTNACPNCGYTPARKPAVQRVEQTVIHKHVYEEPVRTSPTPTQARQIRKKGKGCGQCHLDNDIVQRAKKTDYQKKVVSFSLPEKGKHSRHTKQTDAFICEKNVYNKIVRLLCRGSLLPTGI